MDKFLGKLVPILLLLLAAEAPLGAAVLVEEPRGPVCDEDSTMAATIGSEFDQALASLNAGQYQKALRIYLQWLPRIMEKGWLPVEARVRLEMGLAFDGLGDPAQAAAELNRALQLYFGLGDLRGVGHALLNLGTVMRKLGRLDLARQSLEASVLVWWKLRDDASLKLALANLAQVNNDLGNATEARHDIQTALDMSEDSGGEQACLLLSQACVTGQAGDLQTSTDEAIRGSERGLETGDPEAALWGQLIVANNLAMQGHLEAAYGYVVKALEQAELQESGVTAGELKTKIMDRHADAYAMAVTLSAELGRPAESFLYAEKARARALLDQFSQSHHDQALETPDLRSQLQAMTEIRTSLRAQIREERLKSLAQQDAARLARLQKAMDDLQADQAALRVRIEVMSPEPRASGAASVGIEDVQAVLDRETSLVLYFVSEETIPSQKSGGIYAWILRKDGLDLVPLTAPTAEVARKIILLRRLLENREPQSALAAELYQDLFAPLVPYIRSSRLILIPHGVLHQLPFAALWNAKRKRYLIDEYVLGQAPSAGVLVRLSHRGIPAGKGVLVMGNPDGSLPYAAQEARKIAAIHGVRALLGHEATEDSIQQADGFGILHIAAHGSYDPAHPLFSRIDLAPGQESDGRLELQEILELNLEGTSLAVLSGCRTQAEAPSAGDELAGLPRALLLAGARRVVAGLWNVDDRSTAFLMERLHRHLKDRMRAAEALRRAQIETRARYPHPYDWAGFFVTGAGG